MQEIIRDIRGINAQDYHLFIQRLNELPDNENVTYISRILKEVSQNYVLLLGGNVLGGVPVIKNTLITQLNNLRGYIINNYAPSNQSSLIGSVLTSESRNKAYQIIDCANDTLTKVIANLKGAQNELTLTARNLETLTINLSEASSNYLDADYEKIALKLIELLRNDKMASLAFTLSEKAINSVVSQMENIANHN